MLALAIGIIVTGLILLVNEELSRKQIISKELARKIPHIALAVAFAIMPFYIGLHKLALLALIDIFVALLATKFNWFAHSRAVDRLTWGEYFFLTGSILAALTANSNWIFVAAMLTLGLADAAAALVGIKYGKHAYKILGSTKTIEGTLAFIIVANIITSLVIFVAPSGLSPSWLVVVLLPLFGGMVEAVMPYGLDNLALPLLVVVILNLL